MRRTQMLTLYEGGSKSVSAVILVPLSARLKLQNFTTKIPWIGNKRRVTGNVVARGMGDGLCEVCTKTESTSKAAIFQPYPI